LCISDARIAYSKINKTYFLSGQYGKIIPKCQEANRRQAGILIRDLINPRPESSAILQKHELSGILWQANPQKYAGLEE
jgi:hypothetical protein